MTSFGPMACLLAASFLLASCRGPSRAEVKLAERLNKEAAAANARAILTFDPATDTIVTDAALSLVKFHGQGLAFSEDPSSYREEERYTAYRLVRYPGCEGPPGGMQMGFHLRHTAYGPDICLLTTYEQPPAAAVRVQMSRKKLEIGGVDSWQRQLVVGRPHGAMVVANHYYPGHSDWVPAWAPLLVHSLGLKPAEEADPIVADEATARRLIAESRSRKAIRSERWVEQLAQTGSVERRAAGSADEVPVDILGQQAAGLVRQFERGLADPDAPVDRNLLTKLLARLDPESWQRYAGRIIAAMVAAPELELDDYGGLARRLGNEGARAAPVLSRFIAANGSLPWYVAIAACRIGDAAPPKFRNQLLHSWRRVNQPILDNSMSRSARRNWMRRAAYRECRERAQNSPPPDTLAVIYDEPCWSPVTLSTGGRALYVGLKRMGLGDEADRLALHRRRADYKRHYQVIGPASPSQVCEVDR